MTDLLDTLPNFPTKSYTHLLPSLEKHLITTTDLLTLDALEIAKRAQLPLLDVRRLANHVIAALQAELGITGDNPSFSLIGEEQTTREGSLRKTGKDPVAQSPTISTLSPILDNALAGGIPTGYITEITGESGAGKTQFLLTLLLSAQLPAPHGLVRPTCYISTEHPLPTTRLSQLLSTHPLISTLTPAEKPSLNRILTLQTPDLESQDHILTYQLPVALSRHNIGLVVIDSIAANYRAERDERNIGSALATRSAQLIRLGAQLGNLARVHNCAIVVANQVADRFAPVVSPPRAHPNTSFAFPHSPHPSSSQFPAQHPQPGPTNPLTLDHQQRFFTGWGASPNTSDPSIQNLKTPSLGLVWANQIACRVALIKELAYGSGGAASGMERAGGERPGDTDRAGEETRPPATARPRETTEYFPRHWKRSMRVAFAAWAPPTGDNEGGIEIEAWAGGIRAVAEES